MSKLLVTNSNWDKRRFLMGFVEYHGPGEFCSDICQSTD